MEYISGVTIAGTESAKARKRGTALIFYGRHANGAPGVVKTVRLTQAQFNALAVKMLANTPAADLRAALERQEGTK